MTYLTVVDFEVLIFPNFFEIAFAAAWFGDLAEGMVDAISSPWAELSTKALSAVLGSASVIIIGVAAWVVMEAVEAVAGLGWIGMLVIWLEWVWASILQEMSILCWSFLEQLTVLQEDF